MACALIAEASAWLHQGLSDPTLTRWWGASATAFALVAAAEFGDKSQLVCMALATRHRHWPIFWGALLAFAVLNGMAVGFGAAVGAWLPEPAVAAAVAVLFTAFGIRALAFRDAEDAAVRDGHGLFVTTFSTIFLAEFGDKTQLAVAGLGAAEPPAPVWLGATLALGLTSAVGIWAGRTLLQKVPRRLLHRAGGLVFLGFAVVAAVRAVPPEWRERMGDWLEPWITQLAG